MTEQGGVRLERYRIFNQVAESGSISRAAQVLYLSQPAVSQTIAQLERQLQVKLFDRTARGVALTREGMLLFDYTSRALSLLESGAARVEQSRLLLMGDLIIGASDTVTKTYLLPRLEAFHRTYPGIRLRLINGTSQMLLDDLLSRRVDIAFASQSEGTEEFRVRHCVDTHTIFVAAPDYPCDFERVYSWEEIAAFPLILLEPKASSRVYVERFFQRQGIAIKPEFELGSHNLLVSLARIGLGVACVTEEFSQSGLTRGVIRKLKTPEEIPPRAVTMCTLRNTALTPAAERFLDFVSESNGLSYDKSHSFIFDNDRTGRQDGKNELQ